MKIRVVSCAIAFVICLSALNGRLVAADHNHDQPHYKIFELRTLGGTAAGGNSINELGWASGFSDIAGNQTQHVALWAYGLTVDLGTLGGPNSGVEWLVHNNFGKIAGISETAELDPLGEEWSCSAFFPQPPTGHVCRGFVWQPGKKMNPLPTLGGDNGYAAGMNNLGQIAGWAENNVHDSTCTPPQVLQFEAVVYGPNPNQIKQLPPLAGDPDSAATAINDKGQVVGISGICATAVGGLSAAHALLWQNGQPMDIGNFGGVAWNTPTAINKHGDIVGFSDFAGDGQDSPNFHAFLWTREKGMIDLGTLPGDSLSEALGINEEGQIVGASIDANGNFRAFLWQNGQMLDLNSLVSPGSPFLVYANDINSFGQITGQAYDQSTGNYPAFFGFPTADNNAANVSQADHRAGAKVALPQGLRQQVLRRFGLTATRLAR